jgi:hypothetical protein
MMMDMNDVKTKGGDEIFELIHDEVTKGSAIKPTCESVGVNFSSYYDWLRRTGRYQSTKGLICQNKLAKKIKVSNTTLRRLRLNQEGPPFKQIGKRFYYSMKELKESGWLAKLSGRPEQSAPTPKPSVKRTKADPTPQMPRIAPSREVVVQMNGITFTGRLKKIAQFLVDQNG